MLSNKQWGLQKGYLHSWGRPFFVRETAVLFVFSLLFFVTVGRKIYGIYSGAGQGAGLLPGVVGQQELEVKQILNPLEDAHDAASDALLL